MTPDQPLLRIDDLSVDFDTASGRSRVVEHVSLDVAAGERFALVGESGSGKTVTAMSVLRLHADARYQGSIRLDGRDLLTLSERQMRGVRGKDVAMIFQEPMSALNPLYTVGEQICETLELHEGMTRAQAMARAIELLELVRINEPARRAQAYPHQLSGGQRQRAMIAMALACEPRLLIADEPTTALDVTIQRQIVELLLDLQTRLGMAILLITHDLPLVRRFAQRVAVMRDGRIVETGETAALFAAPADPYTRRLIDSRPRRTIQPLPPLPPRLAAMLSGAAPTAGHDDGRAGGGPADGGLVDGGSAGGGLVGGGLVGDGRSGDGLTEAVEPPLLLDARGVTCRYRYREGWFGSRPVDVVRRVDALLRKGETLGIVGESGSGKTTLGLSLLRLSASRLYGTVAFDGQRIDQMPERRLRPLRRRMQVVFQDPFNSLSPRMTVEQLIGEGLALHQPTMTRGERRDRIVAMLEEVGLRDAMLNRYPHEFSGGQRQRLSIARAVILQPELILLDEPTSALDVSVQSQVLELLSALQRKYGLSYLFITHDLAVIRAMAHRVIVMKDGEVVETAQTEALFSAPREPYTRELLGAAAL
ncbi:MAG: dipeptide ABC transporter ATP-binding protein [Burkholderiaceae bacterium]